MQDYQRPPTLHRYASRAELEQSLASGQFRLEPSNGFLTLSFSGAWDRRLFDELGPADACLVIHNTELFGERVHRAVARLLPNWAGIDGAISYGRASPLGRAFTKPGNLARQQEWLFAWRSMTPGASVNPVTINIGSLADFAEIRAHDGHPG